MPSMGRTRASAAWPSFTTLRLRLRGLAALTQMTTRLDRPLPDEAVAALNRLVDHLPRKDLTLIVLKAHLLIERQLRDIVRKHAAPTEVVKMEGAKFWTLTRVARALVGTKIPDEGWDAVDTLNQLRNEIAHQLNSPKVEALAIRFVELQ
jgi:hypothetical protein